MHRERRASAICDKPLNLPMFPWMMNVWETINSSNMSYQILFKIHNQIFLSAAFPRRNCSTLQTFSMKYEMHFISRVGLNKPFILEGEIRHSLSQCEKWAPLAFVEARCSGSITLLPQQRKVARDLKHSFPVEDWTLQCHRELEQRTSLVETYGVLEFSISRGDPVELLGNAVIVRPKL